MRKKNIVVVGGGTGNRTTLTGLKNQDCNLSAVVAMTDSGGSSGRLREELGQLPYGDIRQCLIPLAREDPYGQLMRRLFDYQFTSGKGLSGHNFGNLLLTALTEVTGNTITAIDAASQMLGVEGQVLPVTLTRSNLVARLDDGTELAGESAIDLRRENLNIGIDYVRLDPTAYVYPPVLEAIEQADAKDPAARAQAISAAKAQIDACGQVVGRGAIQLHGGIAMTMEYVAGHFFRRLTALEKMMGDRDYHLERFAI